MTWSPDIYPYLQAENYTAVSRYYEELREREPDNLTNRCLLGLAYLLEGREEQANTIWLSLLTETEEIDELLDILNREATRQKELGYLQTSLIIREYLKEINPHLTNNQLEIIWLSVQLGTFTLTQMEENRVISILEETEPGLVNFNLLLEVLKAVLEYPVTDSIRLLKASLPHIVDIQLFLQNIIPFILKIANQKSHFSYASQLTELCLELEPNNQYLLNSLYCSYITAKNYLQAEATIARILEISPNIESQLYVEYLRLGLAMHRGDWLNIEIIVKNYKPLLETISQSNKGIIDPIVKGYLPMFTHLLMYVEDKPRENRPLQNRLCRLFQNEINSASQSQIYQAKTRLKIGYLSCSLRRHSIGWLSRWLFHYHDKERFEINLYLVNQQEDDITLKWFIRNADCVRRFISDPLVIAQQIRDDQIDILIDLESLTNSLICWILALKPAPIQVTWLGFDATGIPSIDYFIVDPYVLPENAPEYYQEKLWRLPQTYLAIDGFEVGTPTLTRRELNIPPDAVIYLTAQTAMKRHPEIIRLQLKILKEVPSSYLLIKGHEDPTTIEILFTKLAEEEGIKLERLRFLDREPEEVYYANLQIADIVLDTYPFGGATTTLGFLWLGIPIVTLVGEQFAARNSYAFMTNAGISEGIAFTREEYIAWGVKLGLNEKLRSSIHWKLFKNRQTAPLWNAKKFTLEMEKAYYEMASKNL